MPFTGYNPIEVQAGQVTGTHTDFPQLISYTHNDLKQIANGGYVANASGFDIRPYLGPGLTTALTYQLQFYDGTAGTVIMRVKNDVVVGSIVNLASGDAALNTDGSSTGVWPSSHKAMYRLDEATGVNNVDFTAGGNTLVATNSPVQTAGKVKGSLSYNGTNQSSVASAAATIVNPSVNDVFISMWIKVGSFQQVGGVSPRVIFHNIDGNNVFAFILDQGSAPDGNPSAQSFTLAIKDGGVDLAKFTTNTFSVDTWYYVALGYDHADPDIYIAVDGVGQTLTPQTVAFGAGTADNKLYLARRSDGGDSHANVVLDEVRIATAFRSPNCVTAEYNNEVAPSTFATFGARVAVSQRVGSMLGVFQ